VFFFQAEDGIRDDLVTGVQTCALPIFGLRSAGRVGPRSRRSSARRALEERARTRSARRTGGRSPERLGPARRGPLRRCGTPGRQIGRASCRGGVSGAGGGGSVATKSRL